MKTGLLIVSLAALLGGSVALIWWTFATTRVEMSLFGWIALGAGAVVSLALGGGLMALSFYSARRGYDEHGRADISDHEDEPR